MRRVEVIEQLTPNARPYIAVYEFDDNGHIVKSAIGSLSDKEAAFYLSPEVNRQAVRHKWLDNPGLLEDYAQGLPPGTTTSRHFPSSQRLPLCTPKDSRTLFDSSNPEHRQVFNDVFDTCLMGGKKSEKPKEKS